MKRILTIALMPCLAVFGQKIESRKADRTKITRLATAQNHLSVLEFNEPVKEVAVGSSNFKVEWREDKVFIQPLEPNATTNLFIWTASGRQSYELVPAGSVEEMHFAIDEDPAPRPQAKVQEAPVPVRPAEQPRIPAAMLMESTPVKVLGTNRNHERVEIVLQDVYQKDERVYVRYAIVNGGPTVYVPAQPDVFTLHSPRAPQSLIPLANTQTGQRLPAQVEGPGARAHPGRGTSVGRCSAGSERPRCDSVRSADGQAGGRTDGGQAVIPGRHCRRCKGGFGAVVMSDDKPVTAAEVLSCARKRRSLCEPIDIDNPTTAAKVLTGFETSMRQRPDLG